MPAFIDALCYLFPCKSWIIRPLIIAGRPGYPTKQRADCQPGRTNFDFAQITELSGSWLKEPRFSHFSAFRRKSCISLRLRSSTDENWWQLHIPIRSCAMHSVHDHNVLWQSPPRVASEAALRASRGLRGLSCCSKPSLHFPGTSAADLISRNCSSSTLTTPLSLCCKQA